MDKETQEVYSEQKTLQSLVGHQGWPLAREMFTRKILELQNAFDIEDSTPEKMVTDLQARKIASSLLFDFLRQIEGTASQAVETVTIQKSHIYIKE